MTLLQTFLIRTFEHVADVGLFLFNDALLLTRRNVHHIPFTVTKRCTHTFLASVALTSLTVREITHTRCTSMWKSLIFSHFSLNVIKCSLETLCVDVCHAFVLEGPCRSWVCAMEKEEMRDHFLSVLRSTINSALNEHHWQHLDKTPSRHKEVWTQLPTYKLHSLTKMTLTNEQRHLHVVNGIIVLKLIKYIFSI